MMLNWNSIGALFAAAASVIVLVFGLFNSVLAGLVPPVQNPNPQIAAGIASLLALAVLLAIARLAPPRANQVYRQRLTVGGIVAIAGASVWLAVYLKDLNQFVYVWPESVRASIQSNSETHRYVRGYATTELGQALMGSFSVAGAVTQAGGLDLVIKNQLLWTESSQHEVESWLLWHYIGFTTLFCGGLFTLAMAHVIGIRETGRRQE